MNFSTSRFQANLDEQSILLNRRENKHKVKEDNEVKRYEKLYDDMGKLQKRIFWGNQHSTGLSGEDAVGKGGQIEKDFMRYNSSLALTQKYHQVRTLPQVYQLLKKESQSSQNILTSEEDLKTRQFLANKKFNVTEFEQDLRFLQQSVHNFGQVAIEKQTYPGISNNLLYNARKGLLPQKLTKKSYKDRICDVGGNYQYEDLKRNLRDDFFDNICDIADQTRESLQFIDGNLVVDVYQLPIPLEENDPFATYQLRKRTQDQSGIKPQVKDLQGNLYTMEILEKVLSGRYDPQYDENYVIHLKTQFSQSSTYLSSNQRIKFTQYSEQLRSLADQKYSGGQFDYESFCKKLADVEFSWAGEIYQNMRYLHYNDVSKEILLSDIWKLLEVHSKNFKNQKPTPLELFQYGDSLQNQIAANSCEFFENQFLNNVVPKYADFQTTIDCFGQLSDQYLKENLSEEEKDRISLFLIYDKYSDEYIYAIPYFLCRAGLHLYVLDYLQMYQNLEGYQQFFHLYNRYVTSGFSIPYSEYDKFQKDIQSINSGKVDLYRDAMLSLMIGHIFVCNLDDPVVQRIFGNELNNFVWMDLKACSYKFHDDHIENQGVQAFSQIPRKDKKQEYKLWDFQQQFKAKYKMFLNKDHYEPELYQTLLSFYRMTFGQFERATKKMVKHTKNLIEGVHYGILIKELGLLKTRYQFLKLVEEHKHSLLAQIPNQNFIEQMFNALDYQQYLLQMIECVKSDQYITETVTLIYLMEDEQAYLTVLAYYISSQGLEDLITESNPIYLNFGMNNSLTLRSFLGANLFRQLVYKYISMNTSYENQFLNVIAYDKIQDFEQVLKTMVEIQKKEIEINRPAIFMLPTRVLQNEPYLINQNQDDTPIPLVCENFIQILNDYRRKGLDQQYRNQFRELDFVDLAAQAMNEIKKNNYEEALSRFGMIQELPLQESGSVQDKATQFITLGPGVQNTLLSCIVAIGKLIIMIYKSIAGQSQFVVDYSESGKRKKEKIDNFKKILEQIFHYLRLLKQFNAIKEGSEIEWNYNMTFDEIRKIQVEII